MDLRTRQVCFSRLAGSQSGSAIGRRLDAINPTSVTCSLLAIAAVILILGHTDGIYLHVPRSSRCWSEES